MYFRIVKGCSWTIWITLSVFTHVYFSPSSKLHTVIIMVAIHIKQALNLSCVLTYAEWEERIILLTLSLNLIQHNDQIFSKAILFIWVELKCYIFNSQIPRTCSCVFIFDHIPNEEIIIMQPKRNYEKHKWLVHLLSQSVTWLTFTTLAVSSFKFSGTLCFQSLNLKKKQWLANICQDHFTIPSHKGL